MASFLNVLWSQTMNQIRIHDQHRFDRERSRGTIREEQHATKMRKLLSHIPWYAIQARQRLDIDGRDGELRYWLALHSEFNPHIIRTLSETQTD